MCGLAGFVSLKQQSSVENPKSVLRAMNSLISHRGPDGEGTWIRDGSNVGFTHRRLSIIDLTEQSSQPMVHESGNSLVFNGEIYNYRELHKESVSDGWRFKSDGDTETILAQYAKHGNSVATRLRGMFAIALWDESKQQLLIARDRFGIKPLYYAVVDGVLYFASEAKALMPFLKEIATDPNALAEYLTFQYTVGERTLFSEVKQLLPGHQMIVRDGQVTIERYWDVQFNIEYGKNETYFIEKLRELLHDSVDFHIRSDVEVGSYLSGGVDSSLIAALASNSLGYPVKGFHGRFTDYPGYDESNYATLASEAAGADLFITDITASDFEQNIRKVIYHLDHPVAGPGSFPQYMVSKLASDQVKVVLGGQGGDEIFGGYTRYLLAYFEQTIKAAIDGTSKNGNFVVTMESIIPNLGILREYKPLMQQFWQSDLFGPLDRRFLRLIDRSTDMQEEIDWSQLNLDAVHESFYEIFNNRANVAKEAYFDSMTHFEFKTLLPALLQVEDRMSMAHGIESRVPLLDHPLIEFAATIPADIKFKGGQLKYLLKTAFNDVIPSDITNRRDKMGFPVPLKEWFSGPLSGFVQEIFQDMKSSDRQFINADAVLKNFENTGQFSRKAWALLSLELWQQEFHDKASSYRAMLK